MPVGLFFDDRFHPRHRTVQVGKGCGEGGNAQANVIGFTKIGDDAEVPLFRFNESPANAVRFWVLQRDVGSPSLDLRR